jgi:Rrf2 family iron-sulfur cluster assembly transcriptional regulator
MLSLSAQYALRIMAYLATHADGQVLRAKDIASEVNIPAFYLSKILRRMVAAGLLDGTKGHGGGFRIVLPPEKICFADIFAAIEGQKGPATCVFGWDACSDETPCVLHERWQQARRAYQAWADSTTLADIEKDFLAREMIAGPVAPKSLLKKRVRS